VFATEQDRPEYRPPPRLVEAGTNLKSILPVSSSSMRRGQRPTWPVPMAGGDAGSRSGLTSRTAIGVQ
jgi:hypothetical protein